MLRYDSFLSQAVGTPTPGPALDVPYFVASTSGVIVSNNFSVPHPSHQPGDILLAVIETEWNSPSDLAVNNFKEIVEVGDVAASSGSTRHWVGWRRAVSPATNNLTTSNYLGNHGITVIGSVRGCPRVGSPVGNFVNSGITGVNTNTMTFGSLTTALASDLVVFAGTSGADITNANGSAAGLEPSGGSGLSNLAKVLSASTGANSGGFVYLAKAEKDPAGATGTVTAVANDPNIGHTSGTTLTLIAGEAPAASSISLVGHKTFNWSGAGNHAFDFTSLSGGSNSSPSEGDFVVIFAAAAADTAPELSLATVPPGLEFVADFTRTDDIDCRVALWAGWYDASMGAGGAFTSTSSTHGRAAAIYVFRDCAGIDVAPATVAIANTSAADPPAITPSTAGSWIMAMGACSYSGTLEYYDDPSDLTDVVKEAKYDTTSYDVSLMVGLKKDWSSGAFDPAVFAGMPTSASWAACAITIALRPNT